MVPVQKRHLAIRLDPHLVLCVRADEVQRRNVQLEFPRLCKLAETGTGGAELVAADGGGKTGDGGPHVVDAVALETEDVGVGGAVD